MGTMNGIVDTRVKVTLNSELVDILKDNKDRIKLIPKTLAKSFNNAGIELTTEDITTAESKAARPPGINIHLLNEILIKDEKTQKTEATGTPPKVKTKRKTKKTIQTVEISLYLSDLSWLNQFLATLRADGIANVYLNDLLETCHLELPQNELLARNPVLEARCKKLREEQQNREYRKMTKNVDATLKHYPEDTIAYQSK